MPDEQVYFSCPVGKKALSLCQKGSAEAPEYLEYRFGTSKKIELRYEVVAGDTKHKFMRGEVVHASNAADVIWFDNGTSKYLLNLPAKGGPVLEVDIKGKTVAKLRCNDEWTHVTENTDEPSKLITPGPRGTYLEMQRVWGRNLP